MATSESLRGVCAMAVSRSDVTRAYVSIVVDPREVEAAFEVPLEFLLDKRNQTRSTREFEGVQLRIVEFNFAGQRIWGATATMLVQLRKKLIKQ